MVDGSIGPCGRRAGRPNSPRPNRKADLAGSTPQRSTAGGRRMSDKPGDGSTSRCSICSPVVKPATAGELAPLGPGPLPLQAGLRMDSGILAMTKIKASGGSLRIVPLHMYKRPTRTSCKSILSMSRISSPTPSRCQGFSQQIRYQANGQELSKPAFKLVKRAVRRGLNCRPSALRKEGLPGPYKSTAVSLSRPYGMSGHLGGHSRPDVSVAVSLGDNRVQRQAPFTTPLWRPGQGAEPAHGW